MPELPEVETLRRGLSKSIVGKKVAAIDVVFAKSWGADSLRTHQSAQEEANSLVGAVIRSVSRRGKVLILLLSNEQALLVHLKMTGQLLLQTTSGDRLGGGHPTKSFENELPDKSTRIVITFSSREKLFFNDQRKFGWIKFLPVAEIYSERLLERMGPEPLSDEFTDSYLGDEFINRTASVKSLILNQSIVAGVGNIYADEALHYSKIHPQTPAKNIPQPQLKKLVEGIKIVMQESLNRGGTSFSHFINHEGFYGDYLKHARVFNRQGEPCKVCGTSIEKIRVAGRGTHVCPRCQKSLQ